MNYLLKPETHRIHSAGQHRGRRFGWKVGWRDPFIQKVRLPPRKRLRDAADARTAAVSTGKLLPRHTLKSPRISGKAAGTTSSRHRLRGDDRRYLEPIAVATRCQRATGAAPLGIQAKANACDPLARSPLDLALWR